MTRGKGLLRPELIRATALSIALVIVASLGGSGTFAKETLTRRFDALDMAINGGRGYVSSTNEAGLLAWSGSYLLESYLDMWEATGALHYLGKFADQATQIAAKTDNRRGVRDYKNRSRVGWSSAIYYRDGVRMVDLVESGMILGPLTRFTATVAETPSLAPYRTVAEELQQLAIEALQEFEGQWRVNAETGEGYYLWEPDAPLRDHVRHLLAYPMPMNYLAAIGRAQLWLWKATQTPQYRQKAEAIATYVKRGMIQTSDDAYVWHTTRDEGRRIEDLSHGAIVLEFIVLAEREGIVFDRDDIRRLLRTFLRYVVRDGRISWHIDGSAEARRPVYRDSVGRWLELAGYDCRVYRHIFPHLAGRSGRQHPQVALGVAKLAKFSRRCEETRGRGRDEQTPLKQERRTWR